MRSYDEIVTRNDFADFLGISHSKLTYVLYTLKPDNCYTEFTIPKRNGGCREISAPNPKLKVIQKRLATVLWQRQRDVWESKRISPNLSHAYQKKKGIITNATVHRNKRFVLNLDLKDFFASFHFGRVLGFFEKNKDFQLPHEVAVVIAQLACYKGCLPQGAPSSPIITNLICQVLDIRLLILAKKYKLDYTRYADDLTFSTNRKDFPDVQDTFMDEISHEISKAGFSINESKTRLQFRDSRQEVTGLTVNKKVNVNRRFAKDTKAMAHQLYSTGGFLINGEQGTLNQLEGRFSFIHQLDKHNNELNGTKKAAYHPCCREKAYREFLFYRYFFVNELPLILTEGVTDVSYIKAALKKFYNDYPKLISKEKSGAFSFRVSFFRRSDRWEDLFDMSTDGADAMRTLCRFFTGKKSAVNYFKTFHDDYGLKQSMPVILLFDNETESDRPLQVFLKENSIGEKGKADLIANLYLRLLPNSKLFLLTNPLVNGKKECEIEDLFPAELLALELGGKKFCRKDKFDKTKYYGKKIFSQYVLENYQSIDFSGFRPLLDALNRIVAST